MHTTNSGETFVATEPSSKAIPNHFSLEQNYPNPFNSHTVISYSLPAAGNVNLAVYDLLGRQVATLVDGYQHPNRYTIPFDASRLATGTYFYRLNVNGESTSRKMMLLK